MTKQVLYCRHSGAVIEWQDTELFAYAAPAMGASVLHITAEQWVRKALPHVVFEGALANVDILQPSPGHRWDGSQWAQDGADAVALNALDADQLCTSVDEAADSARQAIAGDPLRAMEYAQAAADAQAFFDEGYPKKAVPLSVSAWVIKGRTARQAADQIIAKAAQFQESLLTIRLLRLKAKAQIRAHLAKGKTDLARQVSEDAITAIRNVVSDLAG
jgi:hypothetical protein